jgi:hypothetical protein
MTHKKHGPHRRIKTVSNHPHKCSTLGTYWNYRVLAHADPRESGGGYSFKIHEVHYKGCTPQSYGTGGAIILAPSDVDARKEMSEVLKRMRRALSKPILYAGEQFPAPYPFTLDGKPVSKKKQD